MYIKSNVYHCDVILEIEKIKVHIYILVYIVIKIVIKNTEYFVGLTSQPLQLK